MRLIPYTLQGRFLAGLALTLLLMGTFFAIALKVHTKALLASEAREKAQLMAAHTEAIQRYVRSTLRPAVSKHIPEDDFIIEAMSTSYVTRHILSVLSIGSGSFLYRRVSATPRNPDSVFTAEEHALARQFEANPSLSRLEHTLQRDDIEHFVMARPVYFTADCMRCHGNPDDAPAVLINMYGAENGFWKSPGDMAGLDIISVSMENSSSAVSKSVAVFAAWFTAGMVILFLTVQGFFNRLVVHNLHRVGEILQRVFFQTNADPFLEPLRKEEEIERMVQSIERVATHLAQARQRLSDYAVNLESMVRERTLDLETVAKERKADVQLFISLLSGLNRAHSKHDLFQSSLKRICMHFGASHAFYLCGFSSSDYTIWPPDANLDEACPQLTERLQHSALFLNLEEPDFQSGFWLFPVQTTGHTRGVLGLIWSGATVPQEHHTSLVTALGRQLGIALDNFEALDTLLRQNSLLDSIVEGVPDPIILVEGAGCPVLANSSAMALATELGAHDAAAAIKKDGSSRYNAPPLSRADAGQADIPALLDFLGVCGHIESAGRRGSPLHMEITPAGDRCFTVGLYPLATGLSPSPRTIIHIREVTKEKQLMMQMRQSEKLAVVGQLAAGIAHEINNPLGVIRCYAELIDTNSSDEQQKADIQVILHHVDQAQSVLQDLLDFSRPRVRHVEECRLPEFLRSMLELFKGKAQSAGAELELQLPEHMPHIHVDIGMLEQVLVNLLINAIAAVSGTAGHITLSADADSPQGPVRIHVSDNGPGIDENALVKIFDPFFTTKPTGAGTGLGLTVAYGMVREMNGSLEAHNTYTGKLRTGAVFSVILPITPTDDSYE